MEYKKVKLKEVGEIVSGATPKTKVKEYWNGNIKWITPAEISNGHNWYIYDTKRKITKAGYKSSNVKLLPKGTILLTSRASIGKVAIAGTEVCTNQGFKSIICNTDIIYNEYLYYYLNNKKDFLNSLGRGATFKEISKKIVEEIEISLPPMNIQIKIANALDKAQELIDNRKAQIEKYDELLQSVFLDMFGDPVTNPKGWGRGTIRDLLKEAKYGTGKKADEKKGKYPVLRMNNITYKGNWNFKSLKYVELEEKELEKYLVYKGDILFNRTNSKELVGKTAVYIEENPMAYAGYLVRLRTNEKANPHYISTYLNSYYGKTVLKNMCKSIVGMANINAQEVQDIKILHPPIELQNKFASIVEKVEADKKILEKSLVELENNFNSIMQRAFKGELF